MQRRECGIHGEEGKPGGTSTRGVSDKVLNSWEYFCVRVDSTPGLNYILTRLEVKTFVEYKTVRSSTPLEYNVTSASFSEFSCELPPWSVKFQGVKSSRNTRLKKVKSLYCLYNYEFNEAGLTSALTNFGTKVAGGGDGVFTCQAPAVMCHFLPSGPSCAPSPSTSL